jgi:hypothetical protein
MSDEPAREDADFDHDFWRAHARRGLQEAFSALEVGRIAFGNWERLFLSAAIDHFRDRNFKLAATSAHASLASTKDSHSPGALPKRKALRIFAPNTKDSHEGNEERADRTSPFSHWPPHRWLVLL